MKIARRWVYGVVCSSCKGWIDWSGEGHKWFASVKDLESQVAEYRSCSDSMSLTEYCGCQRRKARKAGKVK